MYRKWLICIAFVSEIIFVKTSTSLEGSPAGYLPDYIRSNDFFFNKVKDHSWSFETLESIFTEVDTVLARLGVDVNIFVQTTAKEMSIDNDDVDEYLNYDKCPGTETPRSIPAEALKYLTISIQSSSSIFSWKKQYNYYQVSDMAKDPNIDYSRPTVMYVGGFMDHPSYPFALTVGVAYKKLGYNVFLLNTNKFTTTAYPQAANNMRTIGKHVAEMLVTLTKHGLNPSKLELVGLSLGGHTISFIAKNYRLMTGMNISRLTGLDPSGPCFRNLGPKDRLDISDADFVDTVNTNIDGYGMAAPVGHVNFYVNGGEYQPGDLFWAPCNVICSHIRAFSLWIAALQNPNSFIAMKCDSVQEARNKDCYGKHPLVTNILGLNTNRSVEGIFYLATHNNYPYFMGMKGLDKEFEFFDSKLNLNKSTSASFM